MSRHQHEITEEILKFAEEIGAPYNTLYDMKNEELDELLKKLDEIIDEETNDDYNMSAKSRLADKYRDIVHNERYGLQDLEDYKLSEHEKYRLLTINPDLPDYIAAHKFSAHHREMLEKDSKCGCFDCLEIFNPSEIEEWIYDRGHTAICPYCGIDSVIGESSGYPITKEFLKKMKDYWLDESTLE